MSKTPTFLLTGVSESASDATVLSLVCDLENPVTVSHSIGEDGTSMRRVVSDITGVLDSTTIGLEHACVSCAIREDIIPTLASLAASGRWGSIISRLPLGADATQICRVAAYDPSRMEDVAIAGVINTIDGCAAEDHLISPELLCEMGIRTFEGDTRGVAETSTALLEYADVVAVNGELIDPCAGLVEALARPGARIVPEWSTFDASTLAAGVHDFAAIEAWVHEVPPKRMREEATKDVWRIRLRSDRALHPQRFQEKMPELGGGLFRARGCFWVPTRPDALCVWDGASGQVNIGNAGRWPAGQARRTDIVLTGTFEHGDPRDELRAAFEAALCTPAELDTLASLWRTDEDGLEPWLGATHATQEMN